MEKFEVCLLSRDQGLDESGSLQDNRAELDNLELKLRLKDNIIDNQNKRLSELETELKRVLAASAVLSDKSAVCDKSAVLEKNNHDKDIHTLHGCADESRSSFENFCAALPKVSSSQGQNQVFREESASQDSASLADETRTQISRASDTLDAINASIQEKGLRLAQLKTDIEQNTAIVDDINGKFAAAKAELARTEAEVTGKNNQLVLILQQIGLRSEEMSKVCFGISII